MVTSGNLNEPKDLGSFQSSGAFQDLGPLPDTPLPPTPPSAKKTTEQAANTGILPLSDDNVKNVTYFPPGAVLPPQAAKAGLVLINMISKAWEHARNPFDPGWRHTQKYEKVLNFIGKGMMEQIHVPNKSSDQVKEMINFWITGKEEDRDKGIHYSSIPARNKCQQQTAEVLRILFTDEGFANERDRYKAFMKAYDRALRSEYYTSTMDFKSYPRDKIAMQNLEHNNPEIAALHAIARALFTKIEMTDFMNSVAQKVAEDGGYKEKDVEGNGSLSPEEAFYRDFDQGVQNSEGIAKGIENADDQYKISPWTKWASSIKGGTKHMDLNPIKDGNPPNVYYTRIMPDGNELTFIRTPTPTIGDEINPAFIAFLRTAKANGDPIVYFNLQDRRSPAEQSSTKKWILETLGFAREDLRVKALEALAEDPEFKGFFTVVTLDKNSDFYWQREYKEGKKLHEEMAVRGDFFRLLSSNSPLKQNYEHLWEGKNLEVYVQAQLLEKHLKKQISKHATEAEAVEELIEIWRAVHKEGTNAFPVVAVQSRADFLYDFKARMFGNEKAGILKSPSFNISAPYNQPPHIDHIKHILDKVVDAHFPSDKFYFLTPKERQIAMEHAYDLIQDYILLASGARYTNTSCKDCIDRGAAEKIKKLAKDMLMFVKTRTAPSPEMQKDAKNIGLFMNAPALWARKRQILAERRARDRHVLEYMSNLSKTNPEAFISLNTLPARLYNGLDADPVTGQIGLREAIVNLNENPHHKVKEDPITEKLYPQYYLKMKNYNAEWLDKMDEISAVYDNDYYEIFKSLATNKVKDLDDQEKQIVQLCKEYAPLIEAFNIHLKQTLEKTAPTAEKAKYEEIKGFGNSEGFKWILSVANKYSVPSIKVPHREGQEIISLDETPPIKATPSTEEDARYNDLTGTLTKGVVSKET